MNEGTSEVTKKKLPVIFISLLLCLSSLWAQGTIKIVSVDRAIIYAEPSEESYKIDTVRRGTALILFEKGIETSEWLYVTFQSKRWKGKVTGFIKADLVVSEEEMLREDQRRMEEAEKTSEVAPTPEEKAEFETKPQEELPDLREAFAKKKPEEKKEAEKIEPVPEEKEEEEKQEPSAEKAERVEVPVSDLIEPEEKEIQEETPQAKEIVAPETRIVEEEEFKRPEPPPPVVTVRDGITELPQSRVVLLPEMGEMVELMAYAIIEKEIPVPPPPSLKTEEKIQEEARVELDTAVIAEKKEAPPPEEEEKEILEETPQAKEIVAPETRIVEEEEFKRPEPPPPVITVLNASTESPQNRNVTLPVRAEMVEMLVYDFIKIETPAPEKAEEKIEEKIEPEEEEPQVVKPPPQEVKPPEQIVQPPELAQPKLPGEIGLLSFGFGYGPSWGGFGGSIQVNTKSGFSIHLGAGLYPTSAYYSEYDWATNEWLYSIGIKYYLPFGSEKFRPYLDVMYGGISVEAVQIVKEIWHYEYTFENIQKTLYGPSFVAGAEWKLGFYALNAYLGLSYNTTEWEYWDQDYFLNGGLGFSLYF